MIHESVPTGFVRICDGGDPLCDVSLDEAQRMYERGDIYWDDDLGYQLTPHGRTYLRTRFLN